jgi:hypothetical protein
MVSTFVSLSAPSQAVISFIVGGLLVLLVAAQLMDFRGSRVQLFIFYLRAFTAPLLVLFVLIIILRIIAIVV